MSQRVRLSTAATAAYVACIVAANWLTATFGLVAVGVLGMVTAGTFTAGLSFVARDALQDVAGRRWVLAAVIAGAALSAVVSPPTLALASGVTFLVSEICDMAIYTPLRARGKRISAWLASNTVGALVDSVLFLWLAGFPMSGFAGQAVVKVAVGVATPLAWLGVRRAVLRHGLDRAGA